MIGIHENGELRALNNGYTLGSGGGSVTSTDVPTANTISEFDSNAHMNSTDMTTQDVDDFVDSLDVVGHGITIRQEKTTVSVPAISAKAYTSIPITAPATTTNEKFMGNRIIVFDAAHQATLMYYNSGWYLNVFNAYNGTSTATTAEVWWLIIGGVL